jgi:acetyl-CoA synthetase
VSTPGPPTAREDADMTTQTDTIDSVLTESRVFAPPAPEAVGAPRWLIEDEATYRSMYAESVNDPEAFYGAAAKDLHWFRPWDAVVEFTSPDAVWFKGGTTNLCYNCVDRHVADGRGDAIGLVWEGEPMTAGGTPEVVSYTYAELQRAVSRFANALKAEGVGPGDVVTIYMGMVPELAIACLACARIGAVHSVIFGGFAAHSIVDRVQDADSNVIVTCDGAWRRGKTVPLKANVDEACAALGDAVKTVVCLKRVGNEVDWTDGRDVWWHDAVGAQPDDCPCAELDSEATAFILYTSGSTGKPKGIKHTVGGYMVHTYLTSKYVFNLIPGLDAPARELPGGRTLGGQVYWCTADVGWITGHSYIIYGVMTNGVPTLMYEGAPDAPDCGRFWDIVERHKVTQFYTAPTAIRAFMKWGREHCDTHDLTSLQVLGSVGEPINPEAWMWYREVIGRGVCPIVDTWWQTETGGHMLTTLPGAHMTKPGSCGVPFFGVDAAICDEDGGAVERGGGLLCVRKPWPSMLRGIWGDRDRFIETYWQKFDVDGAVTAGNASPYYFAGDGAQRDSDGYFWIMGRVDDVINVSGHRMGTAEVESSLVAHPAVVEAAVVGMPHEIKGTGIAAFCILEPNSKPADAEAAKALKKALRAHVGEQIGAIAKPDLLRFTDALPKTRSGKIMRRLLRDIAAGKEIAGDTTTLEDRTVVDKLMADEG